MAPWVGIEPTTNGLTVRRGITNYLNYQSLAALATPHSSQSKAHFRHSQSGLGTVKARSHLRILSQSGGRDHRSVSDIRRSMRRCSEGGGFKVGCPAPSMACQELVIHHFSTGKNKQ